MPSNFTNLTVRKDSRGRMEDIENFVQKVEAAGSGNVISRLLYRLVLNKINKKRKRNINCLMHGDHLRIEKRS